MDVKTLIEMLTAMPQEAPVKLTWDDGYGVDEVRSIRFDSDRKSVLLFAQDE